MVTKAKRATFPAKLAKLDTSDYRMYWNDTEVSEVEYKKLEQEALEYNLELDRAKAALNVPEKKRKKK